MLIVAPSGTVNDDLPLDTALFQPDRDIDFNAVGGSLPVTSVTEFLVQSVCVKLNTDTT